MLGWAEPLQTNPARRGGAALQTLKPTAAPCTAGSRGLCELSPSPFRLLGLEIRELLLIRPQSCPYGATLSVLLTGEMSKPVVTTMLGSVGQRAWAVLAALVWGFLKHLCTVTSSSQDMLQTSTRAGAVLKLSALHIQSSSCLMGMGRVNSVCVQRTREEIRGPHMPTISSASLA